MLDRMVRWSSPPVGWRLLIVPITVVTTLSSVLLNDAMLLVKGTLRKLILYPTEPGSREAEFVTIYLHRIIEKRNCKVCRKLFWTIGEARVCRELSCYMVDKRGG